MRLALNNTVVFVRQARVSSTSRMCFVALAALLVVGGCRRGKKPPSGSSRTATTSDLSPLRPPPPPAGTLPPPAAVPPPEHRGGTLRFHLDGEPPNLMPLGDAEASALQVTSGLVYETLIDCSDGTYRPALAESWDVSDDRMRLAVRVRGGVHWHDHRAFGVMDVQATLEPLLRKGNDAAALRAALADVASVELVTERTIRFVLKRPSDLVLRALCDIPILPEHIIRGVRGESASIARQPIGTGPFRFAGWERGKRIRLERWADYWGTPAGVDEIVFDARRRRRARAESHAARRDRRAVARARRALPGAGRTDDAARRGGALPAGVAPLFVPRRQQRTRAAVRRALPARDRDAVGPPALRGRAAQRSRAPDRRAADRGRRAAAAVRSRARDRAARGSRLPRQRRGRRARSRLGKRSG